MNRMHAQWCPLIGSVVFVLLLCGALSPATSIECKMGGCPLRWTRLVDGGFELWWCFDVSTYCSANGAEFYI